MNRLHVWLLAASAMLSPMALAEIGVDELIRQSGLTEGPVATRDLPRWGGAQKILVGRLSDSDVDALRKKFPETSFVAVASVEDAIPMAHDVDAIIGLCSERLVAAAEKLVWIQIFSSGAERCLAVTRVAQSLLQKNVWFNDMICLCYLSII